MLTFEKAKEIGLNACIDKLGRDFVERYAESTSSAYGDDGEGNAFCFVGVDDKPNSTYNGTLSLTSKDEFPYRASCLVSMATGVATFLDCVLPSSATVVSEL